MTELTTLQKALYTIKKLKQLLNEKKRIQQPIAIIGLSCRFPQAIDKKAYWQLLSNGKSAISSIPEERWELLKGTHEEMLRDKTFQYWGSYLNNIDLFDAYFFGISPREAMLMDPQQRWLLEVVYEAIEDAGLPVEFLANSNTGVFAGLDSSHFVDLQDLGIVDTNLDALYLPTGNAMSIAANRISYVFDLHGPSMVIDTACSASLVAAHLACLNLQNSLCDLALVCTANINFLPIINLILSKATMLSPDGTCKVFDANANGYIPGEGVGVIVLKPLDKAIKDKDRIYAVIESSAVNQDGATNGLTAPNGLQQEKLIKSVYMSANIDPQEISYVECHGTGTFLGDPIEIEALGDAISTHRTDENPCYIGSVKANIGHLEPAAGIASLIKVALALENKKIPPQINFHTPNPYIDFHKYHFHVPRQLEEWPKYGSSRIAAVSAFGFGGTNAHMLLRELTSDEKPTNITADLPSEELFTLSAKNQTALKALIEKWCNYLSGNLSLDIAQLCYNMHVRRSHYAARLAVIVNNTEQLYNVLCGLRENFSEYLDGIFIGNLSEIKPSLKNASFDFTKTEKVDLNALAKHYVTQGNIDWHHYEAKRSYIHCDIPLYPWQYKHYWPNTTHPSKEKESLSSNDHPLKGKLIPSPLSILQFSFEFSCKIMPEIRDTYNLVHAGYYFEMLAFAAKELKQINTFTVEALVFLSPLIIPQDKVVTVQLIMEKSINDQLNFSFYSNQPDQSHWVKHANGVLLLTTWINEKFDSIIALREYCTIEKDAESFYQRVSNMGLPTGNSIRWLHRCWLGENEILCEFHQPNIDNKNETFALQVHPGIIDGSIQPIFMLLPPNFDKGFIASNIGKMQYKITTSTHFYLFASLRKNDSEHSKLYVNWCLFNQDNEIIALCENLCLTQINHKIDKEKVALMQDYERIDLSNLSKAEQEEKIIHYLIDQAAMLFSMPKEDIDISQSLQNMGMDSLMALVLTSTIETSFGVTYSMQDILRGSSILEIKEYILTALWPVPSETRNLHLEEGDSSLSLPLRKPELGMTAEQATLFEMTDGPVVKQQVNPWIAYRRPQKNVKMRLFCFPYGGGGASIYREWQDFLPDSIEVCPIQLPGREERLEENLIDNIDTLIYNLIENLQLEFDLPFAFFGHSFGSLIAFTLTRYLRQNNLSLPEHLFVSAYPDPSISSKILDRLLQQLSEIGSQLFDLNDYSLSSFNDEELTKIMKVFINNHTFDYGDKFITLDVFRLILPIFIGDMRIVRSYFYSNEPPLDVPITVFLGQKDTWVSYADHLGWAAHTRKRCQVHEFNSGHLFIREEEYKKEMLQIIANALGLHIPCVVT